MINAFIWKKGGVPEITSGKYCRRFEIISVVCYLYDFGNKNVGFILVNVGREIYLQIEGFCASSELLCGTRTFGCDVRVDRGRKLVEGLFCKEDVGGLGIRRTRGRWCTTSLTNEIKIY